MEAIRKDGRDWALFVLRFVLGSTFIMHGAQKVLGLFDGKGLSGFAEGVSKMGIPAFFGYLAALFEFAGGWLVLLGIATELGALLIVPVMLVAVLKVHFDKGYFLPNGAEYSLNLLLICIALILGGPGKQALWDPMARWRSGH